MRKTKYIFVVGGVMSSVGKGVVASSIGAIVKARGHSVSLIKCDMYVNLDAGTMRPTEHGEVFVGDDGVEADQDLGNYERFIDQTSLKLHYITTGQVYDEVIRRERNLEYGGEDVEVVPDIPNEIIRRIKAVAENDKSEFIIVEIGGTVGEYQSILFLEAARMMKLEDPEMVLFVLVSYLPIPKSVGEMKTKPTQYAARTLNSAGIQADFIVCRAEKAIDAKRREKLATFCNIEPCAAISSPDVSNIYEVPVLFADQKFDEQIFKKFNMVSKKKDMVKWRKWLGKIKLIKKTIKIGIVGKYFNTGEYTLADSYISVIESLKFASWAQGVQPIFEWINPEPYEKDVKKSKELSNYDCILVPGGFGSRGIEGKIIAAQFARENGIPYFGLCLGMQIMTIEFARNVLGIKEATSEEFEKNAKDSVIHIMPDQKDKLAQKNFGGSMRLGTFPCSLVKDTIAYRVYKKAGWINKGSTIHERHRHRYEFNNEYIDSFEDAGLTVSGIYRDRGLAEIVEARSHPWMVGVQFHPEFTSRPLESHPLFDDFIRAAVRHSQNCARDAFRRNRLSVLKRTQRAPLELRIGYGRARRERSRPR